MIYGERPHLSINPELWRPFFILRDRGFRKCDEKLSPADQTDFLATKPQVTRMQKSSVLGDSEFFPALPKSESAKSAGKANYATCIQ